MTHKTECDCMPTACAGLTTEMDKLSAIMKQPATSMTPNVLAAPMLQSADARSAHLVQGTYIGTSNILKVCTILQWGHLCLYRIKLARHFSLGGAKTNLKRRKFQNYNYYVYMLCIGKHPVSALQEISNKKRWGCPKYNLINSDGPAHLKTFLYEVGLLASPPHLFLSKEGMCEVLLFIRVFFL